MIILIKYVYMNEILQLLRENNAMLKHIIHVLDEDDKELAINMLANLLTNNDFRNA